MATAVLTAPVPHPLLLADQVAAFIWCRLLLLEAADQGHPQSTGEKELASPAALP